VVPLALGRECNHRRPLGRRCRVGRCPKIRTIVVWKSCCSPTAPDAPARRRGHCRLSPRSARQLHAHRHLIHLPAIKPEATPAFVFPRWPASGDGEQRQHGVDVEGWQFRLETRDKSGPSGSARGSADRRRVDPPAGCRLRVPAPSATRCGWSLHLPLHPALRRQQPAAPAGAARASRRSSR